MSIFGRALGAVGRAGNQMASRYIDEQLAQQRAQFLADLQHQGMVKADQYQNSDERRGRLREQATQDAVAAGGAADTVAINRLRNEPLNQAGRDKAVADARAARGAKVEELNDPALQQATDAAARRTAERDASIERDKVKGAAADPDYLKAAEAIALSDPKAKAQIAASRAQAASAFANAEQTRQQTEQIRRVNDLTKEMQTTLDDPKLSDTERAQRLAGLQSKLAVMGVGGKKGEGGSVTEEVEEKIDPTTGQVIERTRKTKGPLGAAGAADAKGDPSAQLKAGVEQARKDGKIGDAITELRKMGASPAQILAAGVTAEELQAASQPTRGRAGGGSLMEQAAPRDPIAMMSDRDLQRVASIPGHANQAKAQEELRRRQSARDAEPAPSGIGYGFAAP